jgi:hypothetical protein
LPVALHLLQRAVQPHVPRLHLLLASRGVAVQVESMKATFEIRFSRHRLKGWFTRRFQGHHSAWVNWIRLVQPRTLAPRWFLSLSRRSSAHSRSRASALTRASAAARFSFSMDAASALVAFAPASFSCSRDLSSASRSFSRGVAEQVGFARKQRLETRMSHYRLKG